MLKGTVMLWCDVIQLGQGVTQIGKHASSADATAQADWENNRLINITIGQTIGEMQASLRVGTSFPTWGVTSSGRVKVQAKAMVSSQPGPDYFRLYISEILMTGTKYIILQSANLHSAYKAGCRIFCWGTR